MPAIPSFTRWPSSECGGEHLIAAYYSFIDPERMKG